VDSQERGRAFLIPQKAQNITDRHFFGGYFWGFFFRMIVGKGRFSMLNNKTRFEVNSFIGHGGLRFLSYSVFLALSFSYSPRQSLASSDESVKDFVSDNKGYKDAEEKRELRKKISEFKREQDDERRKNIKDEEKTLKKEIEILENEKSGLSALFSDAGGMKTFMSTAAGDVNSPLGAKMLSDRASGLKAFWESYKTESDKVVNANFTGNDGSQFKTEDERKAKLNDLKNQFLKSNKGIFLDDGTWVGEGVTVKQNGKNLQVHPTIKKAGDKIEIEYRLGILADHLGKDKDFSKNKYLNKLGVPELEKTHLELLKTSNIDLGLTFKPEDINATTSAAILKKLTDKDILNALNESARSALKDRTDTLGKKGLVGTDIGDKHEDLKDLTKSRNERISKLEIKKKIAAWLVDNNSKDMSDCEIILKVLNRDKKAAWKMLDEETAAECSDYKPTEDPKAEGGEAMNPESIFEKLKQQAEKEEAQNKENSAREAAINQERVAKSMQELAFLQAYCESYRMSENAKAASDQIVKPIEKLQDAIIQSGATSTTFAKLCSPLSQENLDGMFFDLNYLEDYSSKAAQMAQDYSRSVDGNKQLIAERDTLQSIVRKSFAALEKGGAVMGNAQVLQTMIDPNKIHPDHAINAENRVNNNLNIAQTRMSRLAQYHNCALAGLNAIQLEINAREEEMNIRLGDRGLTNRNGNPRNVPVIGGPAAGSLNRAGGAGSRAPGRRNNYPTRNGSQNGSRYLNN
jgi:hypothetical protein